MSDNVPTFERDSAVALPLGGDVDDYIALLKPRLMSLSIFTSFVGMVAAPVSIHPFLSFVAILAIALGAGASAALNMWYDADIDAKMQRTSMRPIPRGRLTRDQALSYGVILSGLSVFILGVFVNWLAAGLLALTIFYYAVIYTMWLKRRTPQNIVIGGAAGALPPMIGWAASTGSVSWASFSLFLIIFLWTPPHFWALSLYRSDDYKRANIPMLPVVKGANATRLQILLYTFALLASTVLPVYLGVASFVYGFAAIVLGAVFLQRAVMVYRLREGREADKAARRLFLFSIFYLFALFTSILIDKFVSSYGPMTMAQLGGGL